MGDDLIQMKIHCKFCNLDGDHQLVVAAKWREDHILSTLLVDSDRDSQSICSKSLLVSFIAFIECILNGMCSLCKRGRCAHLAKFLRYFWGRFLSEWVWQASQIRSGNPNHIVFRGTLPTFQHCHACATCGEFCGASWLSEWCCHHRFCLSKHNVYPDTDSGDSHLWWEFEELPQLGDKGEASQDLSTKQGTFPCVGEAKAWPGSDHVCWNDWASSRQVEYSVGVPQRNILEIRWRGICTQGAGWCGTGWLYYQWI